MLQVYQLYDINKNKTKLDGFAKSVSGAAFSKWKRMMESSCEGLNYAMFQ